MTGFWSKEQVERAKADVGKREEIKHQLEECLNLGRLDPCYPSALSNYYELSNRVATEDAIRHFCRGIGIVNPLYCNRDYARNSIAGALTAPPLFLHAISMPEGVGGGRMPDYVTAFINAGVQIEWFRVIREGDEFSVLTGATEVMDITREGTALQFLVIGRKIYKNQRGEVVAVVITSCMRIIQPAMGLEQEPVGRLEQVESPPHFFSDQELDEWYQLTEQEEIRGVNPRYWEDINVGDKLPPTHNLATAAQSLAYRFACGVMTDWRFMAARAKEIERRTMPMDPYYATIKIMTPEPRRGLAGLDRPITPGALQNCWLGTLVTNWMGDSGFLKRMEDKYRKPLFTDALVTCKGKVVKKYTDGDEHLVDLHITMQDHNGVLAVPNGSATVVLPSRHPHCI